MCVLCKSKLCLCVCLYAKSISLHVRTCICVLKRVFNFMPSLLNFHA